MFLKMRTWLGLNWKPVFAHGSIISAFLIYCFFLSGPLFDRFETIDGESSMQSIDLPAETGNVLYCLNSVGSGTYLTEVRGWAFVEGRSTDDSQIFVILESDTGCYTFDTMAELRKDVTAAYCATGFNLDRSGFVCNIPSAKLRSGDYVLGIYIKTDNTEAFRRTDTSLVKSGNVLDLAD